MTTNNMINSPTPYAVSKGGTGVSSVTTAPTATAFAGWDANSNLSAVGFIAGYSTTATGGTTTTLVVGSNYQQYFTGSTTQTLVMPVANTLVAGQSWKIVNKSTGAITINSSGGNLILTLPAASETVVTCVLASGTTAASWVTSSALSGSGTVTSGLINQLAWYSAAGNAVSGLTIANSAGLLTNGSGVPAWVAYTGTGAPVLSTSPTIITPLLAQINDQTQNLPVLSISSAVSSVNYLAMVAQITASTPYLQAIGSDTNIGISIFGKGTGGINVGGWSDGSAAPSGYVGEIRRTQVLFAARTNIASATATDLTSVVVSAGRWRITGNTYYTPSTVNMNIANTWISTTSATLPDNALTSGIGVGGSGSLVQGTALIPPELVITVSTSTAVYLSSYVNLTTGTCTQCGFIQAERI